MAETDSLTIVVVEDNELDADLVEAGVRAAVPDADVRRFDDGDEALAHLLTVEQPPSLVLLDLNLPGTDGRDILAALRDHPPAQAMPVVILTSSCLARDVRVCRQMGANGYLCKPMNAGEFRRLVGRVVDSVRAGAALPWPASADESH